MIFLLFTFYFFVDGFGVQDWILVVRRKHPFWLWAIGSTLLLRLLITRLGWQTELWCEIDWRLVFLALNHFCDYLCGVYMDLKRMFRKFFLRTLHTFGKIEIRTGPLLAAELSAILKLCGRNDYGRGSKVVLSYSLPPCSLRVSHAALCCSLFHLQVLPSLGWPK